MAKPGNTLLSAARDEYLHQCSLRMKPKSVMAYTYIIDGFVRATGGDMPMKKLRPKHLELYLNGLLEGRVGGNGRLRAPIGAVGYNGARAGVRTFLRWSYEREMCMGGLLRRNPRLRVPKVTKVRLSAKELWALVDAADRPRDRALFALGIQTALRASEIQSLRMSDVNWEARTLRVTVHKSQRDDLIPMSEDLWQELADWRETYQAHLIETRGRMLRGTDYLIPGMESEHYAAGPAVAGIQPRTPSRLQPLMQVYKPWEIVNEALPKIGIDPVGEGMHTLRRSSSRLMFDRLVEERGYDSALRVVQALLHHAQASTTEHYLGLTSELRVRDEFLRTGSLLGPRPEIVKVLTTATRRVTESEDERGPLVPS